MQSLQTLVPANATIEALTPLRTRINEANRQLTVLEQDAQAAEDAAVREGVAAARGVPTRALGIAFLIVVGIVAAEAAQAVGALLLLGLLAAPAATAQALVQRPFVAMALGVVVAVGAMWLGLTVSFALPSVPPSFAVIALAATAYGLAAGYRRLRFA